MQLITASRDTEAELVCVDSYGKKSGMGVLSGGGFMFTVPLNLIRKLLNKVNHHENLLVLNMYCFKGYFSNF